MLDFEMLVAFARIKEHCADFNGVSGEMDNSGHLAEIESVILEILDNVVEYNLNEIIAFVEGVGLNGLDLCIKEFNALESCFVECLGLSFVLILGNHE